MAVSFIFSIRISVYLIIILFRFYGPKSLKVAMSYHLVARTQSCRGDFRSALASEKEAFTIYRQVVSRVYYSCCKRTLPATYCLLRFFCQSLFKLILGCTIYRYRNHHVSPLVRLSICLVSSTPP